MIVVPTIGIGGLLIYKGARERSANPVTVASEDPNTEIDSLEVRFRKLRTRSKQVLPRLTTEDKASKQKADVLKDQWRSWIAEFNSVFDALKDENGDWTEEFRGYSAMKIEASRIRMDLIRLGNL